MTIGSTKKNKFVEHYKYYTNVNKTKVTRLTNFTQICVNNIKSCTFNETEETLVHTQIIINISDKYFSQNYQGKIYHLQT